METGIHVIQDPYSIEDSYRNLIQSAQKDILLLLPTTSAFIRERKIGIIESLRQAASRGVRVQVLTPAKDTGGHDFRRALALEGIEVRRIRRKSKSETSEEARTKILIVDGKEYLVVELKDDSKETFVEAVNLAIHSATQSTVKAYVTLFESLWEQSELYDQLESHDRMQKEFINIAAHELRTPIQPIIGVIGLLESKFENGVEKFELGRTEYDILLRSAKRLDRLALDILEVSRIESSTMKLNKERFDMNQKVRNVIRDLQDSKTELQIKEVLDPEPILIVADKVRIFEVVSNLLSNAIKFTKKGQITIKAERVGKTVQVEVKDTGMGIDPEIMPRLFEKFVTKSEKGTGIGLYISKKIIEAHGGTISGQNNSNGPGATFQFTLSLAENEKYDEKEQAATEPPSGASKQSTE